MMRSRSLPPGGRDEDPTTFSEILQELLWLEPNAVAAVLFDAEGESVDYATSLPSYFTKVIAAHLRIVVDDITQAFQRVTSQTGASTRFTVRSQLRTFFVHVLPDGYALVIVLRRHAFRVSARAVAFTVCRLAKEAHWKAPGEETLHWHPAEVECRRGDRFRPRRVKTGDSWEAVEILGSFVGPAKERGYRCRLQAGAELTLIRERRSTWFADQPVRGLVSADNNDLQPATAPARVGREVSSPTSKLPLPSSDASPSGHVGTPAERGDMWVKETKRAR